MLSLAMVPPPSDNACGILHNNSIGPSIFAKGQNADQIRSLDWEATALGAEALQDQKFVSALEMLLGAQVPMFLTWGSRHSTFYNDAFATVMALSVHSQGASYRSIFPEAWPQIAEVFHEALSGRCVYLEDLRVPLMRQGQLRNTWWTISNSPVFGTQGEVCGVFGVVQETTCAFWEQKSSAFMVPDGVTDTSLVLMWMCDPQGRFVWLNRKAEASFGPISRQVHWSRLLHIDSHDEASRLHRDCVRQGKPFQARQRLMTMDGVYRWYEVQATEVYDEQGQIIGWYGSGLEKESDSKTPADDAAPIEEGSSRLMRQVSETEQSVFWVLDLSNRDVFGVNAYFRDLWPSACLKDNLRLDAWLGFVCQEDRPILSSYFLRVMAGEALCHPFKALTKDGAARLFHMTAFPLTTGGKTSHCIGAVVIEITAEAVQRAYLIETDPGLRDAIEGALKAEGFRVRVFDRLEDYGMIVDDLLPGVTLVGTHKVVGQEACAVLALMGRTDTRPWIAYGTESQRVQDVVQIMKMGAADVVIGVDDMSRIATAAKAAAPTVEAYEDVDQISEARRRISELPRREREVFNGLVEGKTNKLIAQSLSLSPRTVETYRAQMMERLGVRTLSELLQLAALR